MREETKDAIKVLLGVPEIKQYKKYLRLPAVVGRNKRASLSYIKDKSMGEITRVEGEIIATSRKGSALESSGPSYSDLCNGMF